MTDSTLTFETNNPLTDGFWAATRDHRLVVQRCDTCGELRWPPTPGCASCQSARWGWEDVATTGTLWSYAVYHRAFGPITEVPYTVGIIEIAGGLTMIGLMAGDGPWRIGQRTYAVFEDQSDGTIKVKWTTEQKGKLEQ